MMSFCEYYIQLNDYTKAQELAENSLKIESDNEHALLLIARVLFRQGKWVDAKLAIDRVPVT